MSIIRKGIPAQESEIPSPEFSPRRSLEDLMNEEMDTTVLLKQGRPFSLGEEIANSVTHGIGLVFSIVAITVLVMLSLMHGNAWHIASCSVYGGSMVMLYGASTMYHGVQVPRLKNILRTVDHSCIYLLIAGTYTPFTLILVRGGWGWTLFGLVWGIALVGLVFKIFFTHRFQIVSLLSYLAMGWLAVIAVRPILERVPSGALLWLAAGGLFYTVGVYFYVKDKVPFYHTIWHLFVLGGSVCHFFAIVFYIIPRAA